MANCAPPGTINLEKKTFSTSSSSLSSSVSDQKTKKAKKPKKPAAAAGQSVQGSFPSSLSGSMLSLKDEGPGPSPNHNLNLQKKKTSNADAVTVKGLDPTLLCSTCKELPASKIFQCVSGHLLCSSCHNKMECCPNCQVPLNKEQPIRSMVVEVLLDKLLLKCPYQAQGCPKVFARANIKGHSLNCTFNPMTKAIPLCKLLGYKNCTFGILQDKVGAASSHLKLNHAAIVCCRASTALLQFVDFAQILCNTEYQTAEDKIMWKPIIFDMKWRGCGLIFLIATYTTSDKCISFTPFIIGGEKSASPGLCRIEFCIGVDQGDAVFPKQRKIPPMRWSIEPFDILLAENVLKHAAFRISAEFLMKQYAPKDRLFVSVNLIGEAINPSSGPAQTSVSPPLGTIVPLES